MKPVIDVHAHIFNAMDIPTKGYLLSRSDKGWVMRILTRMLAPFIARCIRRKISPRIKRNIFFDTLCKLAMIPVYWIMGKQYREWAAVLSEQVVNVTSEMVNTYKKDQIDLYVPLVIDFEYWFKNSPDNPIKDQIEHIYRKIVLPYKGKTHPFVPFDPARELAFRKGLDNPDGKKEEYGSLNLVKDAIEDKGYIGVKLYNSLGYKPFNNRTVDHDRRRIALHKKKYVYKGDEYDEVLSELYDYCVDNDVPITAHCIMDGIESYSKASWDFGHALFWRDVLSQERYKDLHLNLAHFGWNQQRGEGYHGSNSWVEDICKMLGDFEYLFVDVAHHRVVSDEQSQRFKSDYRDLCRDWPVIKKRLLFGIDWHVIKRVENFENFKERYIDVLKHDGLFTDDEVDDFLGGNALNFLGFVPGGKNRERLRVFYRDNGIDPPEWFKATGN